MLLHCTLAGQAGSVIDHPVELSVIVPAGCSGARLQAAVAGKFGTGRLLVAGVPLSVLTVGTVPLVNGAVLIDHRASGAPQDNGRTEPGAPLLLAVLSGCGAGTVLPLHRGSYRIGRDGTDLAIPDAELSREHARLDVSDSCIRLTDLGSSNGSWVDGRRVRSCTVSTDSLLRCGNSTLEVQFREGFPERPDLRAAGEDSSEPLLVPGPGPAGQRGFTVLAAVLPLVAGIVLAAATGMWMFLAFSALAAVPLLLPALSGRRELHKFRYAVAAAVRLDAERRLRAAPSAARLVLNAAPAGRTYPGPEGTTDADDRADAGAVWLRLGLAEQTANLRPDPADPGFRPPPAGFLPVTLPPSAATLLEGPEQAVLGVVRFFLMQLAGYPRASRTWVHLHGPVRCIPLAARFLARVSLSTGPAVTAARLEAGPGPDCDRGVLILLPGSGAASDLRALAFRFGWQLIDCSAGTAGTAAAGSGQQVLALNGPAGRLSCGTAAVAFIPDLVPEQVFDRFCRQHRDGGGRLGGSFAVPSSCFLAEDLPLSEAAVTRRWAAAQLAERPPGITVPVGRGGAGPVPVDLQCDGPHLLVAGTTGSGKSEFLRTLVTGLAACYPPDQVNFLFVDFKGGSGLAPLAGLPHCVGLLTDLDDYEMDRTLTSLRAEVRRREAILARAGVPDLGSYSASATGALPLPRLVLVVDEFRMLVEDLPAALGELMRIAVIGRSLGVHLVMATQRPQGALTADIRANITSCVVLRVQSDLESADVMGSPLAATIPVDRPGRAYLIRGNGAPEEFQTATLSAPPDVPADTVTVMTAEELLVRPFGLPPGAGRADPAPVAAESQSFATLTAGLWREQGGRPARRPVAAPLPPALVLPGPENSESEGTPAGNHVLLGRVDLPEQQRVGRLAWNPDRDGHLALVGGTTEAPGPGGPSDVLLLVLDQLLRADAEPHLYLLDADGSLACAAPSARVGAWVGPQDPRRAARVLRRIGEEVTGRLAASPVRKPPAVILVVHNWGSWVSAFRSGPLAWAEELVHDLVRDGPRARIFAVLSGDRELVTSRFFPALRNRIYFPAGSTEESRLAWPPLPRLAAFPGRVAVSGPFAGIEPAGSGEPPAEGVPAAAGRHPGHTVRAAQLYQRPPRRVPLPASRAASLQRAPFRVEALPARVTVEEVRSRLEPAASLKAASLKAASLEPAGTGKARLWVGVGGDELLPAGVVLPEGGVLAVLGAPGSGKSALLRTLPQLNESKDWRQPAAGTDPEAYWSQLHAEALHGRLDRAAILLADDADLAGPGVNATLLQLNALGWRVVFTAGFSPGLLQRVPLALSARNSGQGILIGPRTLLDGDLFGVRIEAEPGPPAGRALVIADGSAAAVQLALAPEPAATPFRA